MISLPPSSACKMLPARDNMKHIRIVEAVAPAATLAVSALLEGN